MTDEYQRVVWMANMLPFGQSVAEISDEQQNLKFPGQHLDGETGYAYNYFRDYDVSLGRYIQSDPIGLKGGINTFGYVKGSPVVLKDRLGLWYDSDDSIRPRWLTGIKVHSRVAGWARSYGYEADTSLGGMFGVGKGGGFLRPDIISRKDYGGAVWEVKPMSYQSGPKYAAARSQINTYLGNIDEAGWYPGSADELLGYGVDQAYVGFVLVGDNEFRSVVLHRDQNSNQSGLLFYTLEKVTCY
jgi:RHS repeat-associated protein